MDSSTRARETTADAESGVDGGIFLTLATRRLDRSIDAHDRWTTRIANPRAMMHRDGAEDDDDSMIRLDATSMDAREDDDGDDDVCVRVFRGRRARDRDGDAARARVVGWVGAVRRRRIVGDDDERARGRRRGR